MSSVFISAQDAAAILGLTEDAVKYRCRVGFWPQAFKISNRWQIPAFEVEKERQERVSAGLLPEELGTPPHPAGD